MSARRVVRWFGPAVAVLSLGVCALLAFQQSTGLASVTVTRTSAAQTTDPDAAAAESIAKEKLGALLQKVPLLNAQERPNDYELRVRLRDGKNLNLGRKQDIADMQNLTWKLSNPVSTAEVVTVELRRDALIGAKPVVESPFLPDGSSVDGYNFTFETERSFAVGLQAFFGTPIGKAIAAAFFIAVLLFLLSFIGSVS